MELATSTNLAQVYFFISLDMGLIEVDLHKIRCGHEGSALTAIATFIIQGHMYSVPPLLEGTFDLDMLEFYRAYLDLCCISHITEIASPLRTRHTSYSDRVRRRSTGAPKKCDQLVYLID